MASVNIAMEAVCSVGSLLLFLASLGDWKVSKENKYFTAVMASLFLMIFSDCVSWIFPETVAFEGVAYFVISLNYIFGYFMVWFFLRYLCEYVPNRVKGLSFVFVLSNVLCAISVAFVILNRFIPCFFFFDNGVYTIGKLYLLANVYTAVVNLICIGVIHSSNMSKKDKTIFTIFSVFTLMGIVIDYLLDGFVLTYVGNFICAIMLYLLIYAQRGQQLAQNEAVLARKENELSENRVAIMLSQIQPHFLYNALSTIRVLCRKNPEKAEQATIEFTEFLRGNMDSITADKPVPFEQELAHTKNYLSLEQLRFPRKLKIIYDIGTTGFSLPTLTLQPIVENAVRYGVTKRVGGGTVTIATKETENAYLVSITDDGIGFDTSKPNKDGRTHVGIINVRMRLAAMCGGTLTIDSTHGVGTKAVISLPKEKKC